MAWTDIFFNQWLYIGISIVAVAILAVIIPSLFKKKKMTNYKTEKETLEQSIKDLEQKEQDQKQQEKRESNKIPLEPEQPKTIEPYVINVNNELFTQKEFDKKNLYIKAKIPSYWKTLGWFKRWRLKRKVRRTPGRFIKVRMREGKFIKPFVIEKDNTGFEYNKGRYIIDEEVGYIEEPDNIMTYDFHVDCTLPNEVIPKLPRKVQEAITQFNEALKKNQDSKFPLQEVLEIIESTNIMQTKALLNPNVMDRYQKSDFIQKLVAGGTLTKIGRITLLLVVILMVLVAIDLAIDLIDSQTLKGLVETAS